MLTEAVCNSYTYAQPRVNAQMSRSFPLENYGVNECLFIAPHKIDISGSLALLLHYWYVKRGVQRYQLPQTKPHKLSMS